MPNQAKEFSSLHPRTVTLPFTEELDVDECFRMLAESSVGRVVYTDGALPAITPVRYALDGCQVFFRPRPDARLLKALTGAVVAFEVDQIHAQLEAGWTVVLTGVAEPCTRPSTWPRVVGLDLLPSPEAIEHIFVITPGIITGRRIADT
jgi:nitroimidazol reductase NimA-like FMN-containing flavoprotein (pyridoxamine 5'-phosphate oxidase superfamily)